MATKTQTSVSVKNGIATVFMHKDVTSVGVDGTVIARPKNVEGRVWSFTCSPEVARDLINRYEFAAGSEAGVPLTHDEKIEAQDLKSRSNVEVGRMAAALAQLADERVQRDQT